MDAHAVPRFLWGRRLICPFNFAIFALRIDLRHLLILWFPKIVHQLFLVLEIRLFYLFNLFNRLFISRRHRGGRRRGRDWRSSVFLYTQKAFPILSWASKHNSKLHLVICGEGARSRWLASTRTMHASRLSSIYLASSDNSTSQPWRIHTYLN